MRIGIILGSIRNERRTESVAHWIHQSAEKRVADGKAADGVTYELLDLASFDVPLLTASAIPSSANRQYDDERVRAWSRAIDGCDGFVFVTPEYNRSIPGALKNAIDWASRPWGQNSFVNKPTAVIGTSPGIIATAIGQQHLKAILGFCNTRQLTTPEAYVQFTPGLIDEDGNVTDDDTRGFLTLFMKEFDEHTRRVLTVLPPQR